MRTRNVNTFCSRRTQLFISIELFALFYPPLYKGRTQFERDFVYNVLLSDYLKICLWIFNVSSSHEKEFCLTVKKNEISCSEMNSFVNKAEFTEQNELVNVNTTIKYWSFLNRLCTKHMLCFSTRLFSFISFLYYTVFL